METETSQVRFLMRYFRNNSKRLYRKIVLGRHIRTCYGNMVSRLKWGLYVPCLSGIEMKIAYRVKKIES